MKNCNYLKNNNNNLKQYEIKKNIKKYLLHIK